MAGIPHLRMLSGADLVVDAERIEVLVRAEIEHPQVSSGDQPRQVMSPVVGGDDESSRSVALTERTDVRCAGVTGPKCPRFRIEAMTRFDESGPVPIGWRCCLDSPDLAAGADGSAAKSDGPVVGECGPVASG